MIYLFLSLYLDCVIFLHQLGIVSGESLGLRIDGFVYVFIVEVSIQNEQYLGFARAHAPYYWLDSTQLNFRDRTRPGAVYVI